MNANTNKARLDHTFRKKVSEENTFEGGHDAVSRTGLIQHLLGLTPAILLPTKFAASLLVSGVACIELGKSHGN
jgi:hypothetical protein